MKSEGLDNLVYRVTVEINRKSNEMVLGAVRDILTENGFESVFEINEKAVIKAFDALEKQKPTPVGKRELRKHEIGTPYYCPECEADITHVEFFRPDGSEPEEKVSYCWACGQAIRWE